MIRSACQSDDSLSLAIHDGRIHAAATAALASSAYAPLRKLHCRVREGVAEIFGTVPSFYLKQMAQAALLPLCPLGGVRNLVEVGAAPNLAVTTDCGHTPAAAGR
jgi:hypothetical protein